MTGATDPTPATPSAPPAPGALDGVRIVDFSRVLAGPYATMVLADLGADVVKVERPGPGDETRHWGPPWHGEGDDRAATYYLGVNRNKVSVRLDLTDAADLAEARRLVAGADVVVENLRPGAMERLGLGWDALHADHPGLVYCSISGFGQGGGADLAGYDLVVQAVGGLMSVTGSEESGPFKAGVALVDVVTGLHASVGILAALRHRDRTGEGQRVTVDLLSSLLSALTSQSAAHVIAGAPTGPMGNAHPSIAPYEVLATADRPLAVAAPNDGVFARLCTAIGRTDLLERPDLASNPLRVEHRDLLVRELEATLAGAGADHWFEVLRAAGVPAGPINSVAQAFDLADALGLEPVTMPLSPSRGEGVPQVRNPIGLSATPPVHRTDPPA